VVAVVDMEIKDQAVVVQLGQVDPVVVATGTVIMHRPIQVAVVVVGCTEAKLPVVVEQMAL
jgi:hypothetical protein